jgi:ribosomal-protein-alanine N-acetyltransferase
MPSFHQLALNTTRLLLRPLNEQDAPALFGIFSDARVAQYLARGAWSSISLAHERIARDIDALSTGKYLCLGVVRRDDEKLIGECSLFNRSQQSRRAELGYALDHEAWGQGYINEALEALLTYGFSEMALNRVEADIDPRNQPSAKTLERLGFQKEGHLRERWIVNGELSDTGLYGLLASDWAPKHDMQSQPKAGES